MQRNSESLCKKKMNCLGYVLTFRSLLRVFDFGILALSLSTWTQMNQIHDEYQKISIFSDNRSLIFIMGFLLFVHISTPRGDLAANSVRKVVLNVISQRRKTTSKKSWAHHGSSSCHHEDHSRGFLHSVQRKYRKRFKEHCFAMFMREQVLNMKTWLWMFLVPVYGWNLGGRWIGPYEVVSRNGVTYKIRSKEGQQMVPHHDNSNNVLFQQTREFRIILPLSPWTSTFSREAP